MRRATSLKEAFENYWSSADQDELYVAYLEVLVHGGLDGFPKVKNSVRLELGRLLRRLACYVERRES